MDSLSFLKSKFQVSGATKCVLGSDLYQFDGFLGVENFTMIISIPKVENPQELMIMNIYYEWFFASGLTDSISIHSFIKPIHKQILPLCNSLGYFMFLSLQFLLNNIIFTYKKKSNLLYKCISKFLANRLHGCLNETINYDIVKGMSIFESISSYLLMSW